MSNDIITFEWYYGLGWKGFSAIPAFLAVLISEDLLAPDTASAPASLSGDALLDFMGRAPPPTDFSKEVESCNATKMNIT